MQPIRCWAYWQSQTISKPLPAGPGARVRPSNPSCRAALASWVAILVETDSAAARVIVNAELCWSKDRCPAAVPLSERRSQRLRRHAPCSTCRSSSSTSLHLNDRDLSEFAPPRLGWTPRKDTEGKKTSASFLELRHAELFEQAGFTYIRSKGLHHSVMRKTVHSTRATRTRTRAKR